MKKFPFDLGLIDFNGTLQDDLDITLDSIRAICCRFDVSPPEDFKNFYQRMITIDYVKFYRGIGIPGSVTREELDAQRKEYFRTHRSNGTLLMDGAKEMLSALFPFMKLVIVSGEVKGYVAERLAHLGVERYFDAVYDGVTDKKKAFLTVMRAYEIAPGKIFSIDDTAEGIAVADETGIVSVGFAHKNGYHSEERIIAAKPKILVRHSLFGLASKLKNYVPQ